MSRIDIEGQPLATSPALYFAVLKALKPLSWVDRGGDLSQHPKCNASLSFGSDHRPAHGQSGPLARGIVEARQASPAS
jgi:hypothetical protein